MAGPGGPSVNNPPPKSSRMDAMRNMSQSQKFNMVQGINKSGQEFQQEMEREAMGKLRGSFRKGGRVKKTGIYKVHRNERILSARGRSWR